MVSQYSRTTLRRTAPVPNEPTRSATIQMALRAYKKGQFKSIRASAAAHGISESTLRRHVNGSVTDKRVAHQAQMAIGLEGEKSLMQWILRLYSWGFPPRLDMIRHMASKLAGRKVGENWVRRFMKRHPDLRSAYSRALDNNRAKADDPDSIMRFYNLFMSTKVKYGLHESRIFNMDEKGFVMGVTQSSKVVVPTRAQSRFVKQFGNRELVTSIECIDAKGNALSPFVIFRGRFHQYNWYTGTSELTKKWHFATSPTGWTDNDLAVEWLTRVFEPQTIKTVREGTDQWRMLLLDGHQSHISFAFINKCIEYRIIALCLPPHSTHRLQPLDVGFNAVYAKQYRNLVDDAFRNGLTGLDKQLFIKLLAEARENTINIDLIKAAWRGTGLIPFDPTRVLSKLQNQIGQNVNIQPQPDELSRITPRRPISIHRTVRSFLSQAGDAIDSPIVARVNKISELAQNLMSENIILSETTKQLREANKKVSKIRRGKPRLSEARVLNDEELETAWLEKDAELNTIESSTSTETTRGRGRGRGRPRGGRGRPRGGRGRPRGGRDGTSIDERGDVVNDDSSQPSCELRRGRGRPRGSGRGRGSRGGRDEGSRGSSVQVVIVNINSDVDTGSSSDEADEEEVEEVDEEEIDGNSEEWLE